MANKALSKRQKLMLRTDPAPHALKPRNPVAVAARQKAAGPHGKSSGAARQLQQRLLKRILSNDES